MQIYTAEITVFDPATGLPRTLYFSTDRGFTSKPTDSPANTPFEPRIIQPALLRRDAFEQGMTGGRAQIGYGELLLNNADGGLDDFIDYGIDGRDLVIRVGDESAAYPTGFTTVLHGTMTLPEVTALRVRIPVRDRQFLIPREANFVRYVGNNVLPNGLEGGPELAGFPKPLLWGDVFNITPVQVNSSRLIYQVRDGAITDVPAVYDRGAALTHEGDYSSQVDMESSAPSAGAYRVWPAGGYFRLGSSPTGLVTADVTQADKTASQIIYQILTTLGGLIASDISSTDLADLTAANGATLGFYGGVALEQSESLNERAEPIRALLDLVTRTVGAWWSTDTSGFFRVKRLEAPSGPPAIEFDEETNVSSFSRVGTRDSGEGIPVYRCIVRCVPNWTVQSSDLAGAVTPARRAVLSQPYQTSVASDSTVKTKHLLASSLDVVTLFTTFGDGQIEAARLLALHSVRRDRLEVTATLTQAEQALLDLGTVVRLTSPRYGYASGKLFRVLGYQLDGRKGRANMTLWG